MNLIKYFINIFSFLILFGCVNQTIYSGKLLEENKLNNIDFKNKEILISRLGHPSFIDPIEKKYFYFTEKYEKKSIFKKKYKYSYLFVFKFNDQNNIIETNSYDLLKVKDVKFIKNETENKIIERGLIERIFGGVGNQQTLPTTP